MAGNVAKKKTQSNLEKKLEIIEEK
jgi:hypothetical protein